MSVSRAEKQMAAELKEAQLAVLPGGTGAADLSFSAIGQVREAKQEEEG